MRPPARRFGSALLGAGAMGLLLAGTILSTTTFAAGKKRPSDEKKGRELYDRHCYACHGAQAKGDGPATKNLVQPVPSLQGRLSLDDVEGSVQLVLLGRGAMPGFEATLSEHDVRRVLRHTARLASSKPAAP